MATKFFMPMDPPTVTQQMHKVRIVHGKPFFYEPQEVANARAKLRAHLSGHVPDEPLDGPVSLMVEWRFPATGRHPNGTWRTTKPDTDNLEKMLKDVMTDLGFWRDDAQVSFELVTKVWADVPGIHVEVSAMDAFLPAMCDAEGEP